MIQASTNEAILEVIRASIAAKNIPKKVMARKLKISKSFFSQILQGERTLTPQMRDRIFQILAMDREIRDRVLLSIGI